MCGHIGNVVDSYLAAKLMEALDLSSALPKMRNNPGTGPASSVDMILQDEQGRCVQPAIWWLLLERSEHGGYKPSRYTSFNTRSDKLNQKHSAGYVPYRKSRCIVPATYFIEGEGLKGSRQYHRVEPQDCAFALGGLYRAWVNRETGELAYSCSVITLPPHPSDNWRRVHSKSTPLMLPANEPEIIGKWLDPGFDAIDSFDTTLLEPRFPGKVRCVPVERPGNQRVVGETICIDN